MAKTTSASIYRAPCTQTVLTSPRSLSISCAPGLVSRPRSLADVPAKAERRALRSDSARATAKAELRSLADAPAKTFPGTDVSVAGKAEFRAAAVGIQASVIAAGAARAQAVAEAAENATAAAATLAEDAELISTTAGTDRASAAEEAGLWNTVFSTPPVKSDFKTAAAAAGFSIAAADEAEEEAAGAGQIAAYIHVKRAAACAQKAEVAAREAERAAFASETLVRNTRDAAAASAAYAAVVRAYAATAAAVLLTFRCSSEGWKQAQEDKYHDGVSENRDPWWPLMKASMDQDEADVIPIAAKRIQAAFSSAKRAEASAVRFAKRAKAAVGEERN